MAIRKRARAELEAAVAAARKRPPVYEMRARAARYLADERAVEVTVETGARVTVPLRIFPTLAHVPTATLATVTVSSGGWGLLWDAIDEDYEVEGVVTAALGLNSRTAMRALARIGGRTKSPARAAASRANGAKGGRPRNRHSARTRR
jgi:uncharacterized protein DUF2442